MDISEPELLQHNYVAQSADDPSQAAVKSEGPMNAGLKAKTYGSSRSAALGLAIGGLGTSGTARTPSISPEAVRGNRALQQQILSDMNTRMAGEMQQFEGPEHTNIAETFEPWRSDKVGELTTYNEVLKMLTPEGTYDQVGGAIEQDGLAGGYQAVQDTIDSNEELSDMLVGAQPAFGGSRHYDQQAQSARLMSNYILRVLASQGTDRRGTKKFTNFVQIMKDYNKGSETAKGASGFLARKWQAQAAPKQESLAAKRSRLRGKHFSK